MKLRTTTMAPVSNTHVRIILSRFRLLFTLLSSKKQVVGEERQVTVKTREMNIEKLKNRIAVANAQTSRWTNRLTKRQNGRTVERSGG